MSSNSSAPMPEHFDPDAAAQPGSGIFGLPFTREQSGLVLVPVPFDATTSYGNGTHKGPEGILAASAQVDLFDLQYGDVYKRGIHMIEPDAGIERRSAEARALAEPLIDAGGATDDDHVAVERINTAGQMVNVYTHQRVSEILAEGKIPGLVGGDHSTPFGSILACAEYAQSKFKAPMGILHIDAHMDLRDAFEGFTWSHASIMFNVMERIPQVSKLVQVGIRDFGKGEVDYAKSQTVNGSPRVVTHFDADWSRKLDEGVLFGALVKEAIDALPQHVYVSFDIDGLDPSLCPHTGTPVPGGLSFNRAAMILHALATSGRTIIGFDLVEVAPGPNPEEPEWDANVGARLLYKMCGMAAMMRTR